MSRKLCVVCGAEIDSEEAYCSQCGSLLDDQRKFLDEVGVDELIEEYDLDADIEDPEPEIHDDLPQEVIMDHPRDTRFYNIRSKYRKEYSDKIHRMAAERAEKLLSMHQKGMEPITASGFESTLTKMFIYMMIIILITGIVLIINPSIFSFMISGG